MSKLIKDFLIGYALAALLIAAFAVAVAWGLGIELPLGVGFVPFVVGVQVAAQRYARREEEPPTKRFAWRAALAMTAAAAALSTALFIAFIAVSGAEAFFGEADASALVPAIALVAAFLFFLHIVVGRFFFAFMVRTALKALALEK